MVICENQQGEFGQWFHLACMDIDPQMVTDDLIWYCSESCKEQYVSDPQPNVDHKWEYAKALIWHGLMADCQKDAVRENDGPRMILHWKVDLWFFQEHRLKYFIFGHKLLADLEKGFLQNLRSS